MFTVVFANVAAANGFSPCSLVKLLKGGHSAISHCLPFDVTLTSWEEEETEEEEDSSWVSCSTNTHSPTHTLA